jgi:hypothetical protein
MFLKEGALTDIKVYDTNGTTLLFESGKIYYDETKPQTHPADSFVYQSNNATHLCKLQQNLDWDDDDGWYR